MASEYLDFHPGKYLREYYLHVGPENKFILDKLANSYANVKPNSSSILEIGGGPTIYQLISAAKIAKEIHFTDIAQQNLDEVKMWIQNTPVAFGWEIFFKEALKSEGEKPTKKAILKRTALLRSKITKLFTHDILKTNKLSAGKTSYDIVSSIFSSDGITHNIDQWSKLMDNTIGFLKPGGQLMLVGVFGSSDWVMGDQTYKATKLDEKLLIDTLSKKNLDIKIMETVKAEGGQGYDAVFFVRAIKLS